MSLPQTLYVKEEQERDPEDNFLVAVDNAADISEPNNIIEAGIYNLIRKVNLVNQTIIEEK